MSDFQLLWVFHLGGFCITYGLPYDSTGIDNEWRKTQCMPREVCIDVGKEFGAATNTFFKPPCVSVYRCGGCCNSEGLQCMNTSTSYLSKTVGMQPHLEPQPWGHGFYSGPFKIVQFNLELLVFSGGNEVNFSVVCGFDDRISPRKSLMLYELYLYSGIKAKWRKLYICV